MSEEKKALEHLAIPSSTPSSTEDGDDSLGTGDGGKSPNNNETQWAFYGEYVMSCVGYCCGVACVWRFPYVALQNGGGAFLIPFFFFIMACGIPLFMLELVVAQYSGCTPIKLFQRLSPIFQGLAYSMCFMSWFQCIPYNLIFGWCLFYIYNSFESPLPWNYCGHSWNSEFCSEAFLFGRNSSNACADVDDSACVNSTVWGTTEVSAEDEFWHRNVLNISPSIAEPGSIQLHLVLAMAFAWTVVYFCIFKGIRWSGKVALVTCTVPYFLLLTLFIRGCFLEGSWEGLKFYLIPDFSKLLDFKVWTVACFQVFYCLGPAWGGLHTMASYNKFNHNIYRDSILFPVCCSLTYFLGSITIFVNLGYLAKQADTTMDNVIAAGPGLAFMVYPAIFRTLPLGQFWSILFFATLLFLGIDSQFGMLETALGSFEDVYPKLKPYKHWVALVMCGVGLIIGLSFATQAGLYVFQLIDWYASAFGPVCIGLFEAIVFCYIYGTDRLYDNIREMTKTEPSVIWRYIWRFVLPPLTFVMACISFRALTIPDYRNIPYPGWAIAVGWIIGIVYVLPIPVTFIVVLYQQRKENESIVRAIIRLSQATSKWQPQVKGVKAESFELSSSEIHKTQLTLV